MNPEIRMKVQECRRDMVAKKWIDPEYVDDFSGLDQILYDLYVKAGKDAMNFAASFMPRKILNGITAFLDERGLYVGSFPDASGNALSDMDGKEFVDLFCDWYNERENQNV